MAAPSALEVLQIAAAKFKAGEIAEAEKICRSILKRDVWNVSAMNLLAGILRLEKRLPEALEFMKRVVNLVPNVPEFQANYGDMLLEAGQPAVAEERYRRAISLRPQYFKAWHQCGVALDQLKKTKEAGACFERAVQLEPNHLPSWIKLAETSRLQGLTSAQLRQAQIILQLDPQNLTGYRYRASALFKQGDFTEAIGDLRYILRCDPKDAVMQASLMMSINYDPAMTARQIREEHEESCRIQFGDAMRLSRPPETEYFGPRQLRIGYVSSDFKDHAVDQFFRPVVANHDRRSFAVVLYFSDEKKDALTAWYQQHCDEWRDVHDLTTEQFEAIVRKDEIDLLVDLMGFTGGSRLDVFARRPAPIQITWLGYPSTTGMNTINYLLTDNVMDPPNAPAEMTECPWRLPNAFCTFNQPATTLEISVLPAKSNGFLTFGSMNALAKLNDEVLDLWCRTMTEIPNSKLLVYRSSLLPSIHAGFRERFRKRGIEDHRLLLDHKLPAAGHLAVYHQIDLHLDCWPWNGHTTTCEALWMGVPTLTLLGNRHSARMSASMLTCVGLDNFIAHSPEQFIAIAKKLANDLESLAGIRSGLRPRMLRSPLMNGAQFVKELEDAYVAMWERHRGTKSTS